MFKPVRDRIKHPSQVSATRTKSERTKQVHGVSIEKRAHPEKIPRMGRTGGKSNLRGGKVITLQELKQQATVMIRKLYKEIADDENKMSKNVTAAWANVVDKWAMLSGRPTEIIGYAELEQKRPGMIRLAQRIAAQRERKPS